MTLRARLSAALPVALLAGSLGGCVTEGPFPSLAPRPDERLAIEEPVRAAAVVADDPALPVRIAALLGEARQGARLFDSDYAAAARAAARRGAAGSDSWVEAELALSRVEAARGRTSDAAADLHQLALAFADRPISAGDQEALDAAIAEIDGVVADQQARIDRLR
jgi:hypothetical protein